LFRGGHPDRNKVPFVEASTGSLGHGMPIAVGVALSKKINNSGGGVYVLVGDGECNEGSVWESALLASEHQLNNLCLLRFIDSSILSFFSSPVSMFFRMYALSFSSSSPNKTEYLTPNLFAFCIFFLSGMP
jgi:transketolase